MTSTLAYFKNGIGNWILMTPALQAMASMEKSGKIDVVLDSDWSDSRKPAVLDLVKSAPFVNRVIQYPAEALDPRKYTKWFYSRHSEGSPAMKLCETMNPTVGHKINWKTSLMHEMDYYMNIARTCFDYAGETPRMFMHRDPIPPGILQALNERESWVALCNGGFGKMRGPKCWPHYNALASALRLRYGVSIVGVGGKDELRGVRLDLDLTNELTIGQTASVLAEECDHFITTDTGLMHIADALGVGICMTVLFGGSIVSKNGPVGHSSILRAEVNCVPCQYVGYFDHCKDAKCMKELTVGSVMRSLARGRAVVC